MLLRSRRCLHLSILPLGRVAFPTVRYNNDNHSQLMVMARGFRRPLGAVMALFSLGTLPLPVQAATPQVIAVDGTLCDITRRLAATAADVTCLIPPGGDPHAYRLKPSDRQKLAKASIVVHIGFGLTPVVSKITSSAPVVAVGELALPGGAGGDPHIWHNPANSAAMVGVLAQKLTPLVAAGERAGIAARAVKARAVLADLGGWAGTQFRSLPASQKILVTDHRTYSHLARRYGLKELAVLDSYTTGGVLRPSSLSKITSAVKGSGAKVIFTPSIPPTKTLRRLSKSTGLPIASKPLYAEGVASGQSAVSTAVSNICTMVTGQGGTCDRSAGGTLSSRWASIR